MMFARQHIEAARPVARELDQMLVHGRGGIIRRNLTLIEGRNRSEKYVGRLAGQSDDVYRKSISERAVEFYGAAVDEYGELSRAICQFWTRFLALPEAKRMDRGFWTCDEELSFVLGALRRAIVAADKMRARFYAVQARSKVEEMIRSIESMG